MLREIGLLFKRDSTTTSTTRTQRRGAAAALSLRRRRRCARHIVNAARERERSAPRRRPHAVVVARCLAWSAVCCASRCALTKAAAIIGYGGASRVTGRARNRTRRRTWETVMLATSFDLTVKVDPR